MDLSAQALAVQVRDASHAIADATVTVLRGETVVARAPTDVSGVARLSPVPVGVLTVRVEALGYDLRTVEDVTITAGQVRALDVLLTPKALEVEGLTVETGRIQIQKENTEFSTQVEERAIQLLPVSYDAADLVALTPGARPNNIWGGANFQANSYRIDGVSANDPGMGGDLLKPNVNWIDKVEVRGLGSGAEYGGFQGGLVDVVTKRGDNRTRGFFRTTYQNDLFASTNLVKTEIGREIAQRVDTEGEVRGPFIRDRLFYYASAKRVQQNSQALNHLPWIDGEHTPFQERQAETKLFGKLTWTPTPTRLLEVSGAFTDDQADNYGITGYEDAGGTHRYTAPTALLNASYTEALGNWGTFDARLNHFSRDERLEPYGGHDVPGIRTFALSPPFTSFGNAPFTLRSHPTSTSGNAQLSVRIPSGTLKVGAEYTRGSFLNRRIRNGGMTWMAVSQPRFDPAVPSTWSHVGSQWIPTQWGGEVHLDADVTNAAAYAQSSLSLGRLVLTPGIRWNEWKGWLTPRSGERFEAVNATGWDPRVGASLDLTGDGTLVAKAHWGRYHQSLISQMFDRVGGSDVFTNEEVWYYTAGDLADPTRTFTEAQRDALAGGNVFRKLGEETLNETGPLQDYRQPYVDQWLVGLEKQVGSWLKFVALYTRRSNHDMVALVDINRETNYTRYRNVRIFDNTNHAVVPFSGGSVTVEELWVPNNAIVERLRCLAFADCPDALGVPGLSYEDIPDLQWDPRFVLTTAPRAHREFGQFQLTMDISRPLWGASASFVVTDLVGNLDNVSGYTDPSSYGAGPYVRVNEGVNAYGTLENFANREVKVSLWGTLPWDLRGGAFFTHQSGDHYSPRFRLYGLGFFHYKIHTGALLKGGGTEFQGQEIDYALLYQLEGNEIFVGPRGLPTLPSRSNLDVRLERLFRYGGHDLAVSLDLFNLFRNRSVTQLNTMVNNGPDYGFPVRYSVLSPGISPNEYYQAPEERVPPRALRLGVAFYF